MKMGVGQTINAHMKYNWKQTIFRPEEAELECLKQLIKIIKENDN